MLVLYFGNEFVPEDAIVIETVKRISEKLPHIKFIHMKFPEEILEYVNQEFLILDVARNIDRVTLIEDVRRLKSNIITTLHDFDLAFFLKLFSKFSKTKIKIVAIPERMQCEKELISLLNHMNSISRKCAEQEKQGS